VIATYDFTAIYEVNVHS